MAVSVEGRALAQASGLVTNTVNMDPTVNVPEPDPVQPFVSVTVTL